jgi:hypothetical protein
MVIWSVVLVVLEELSLVWRLEKLTRDNVTRCCLILNWNKGPSHLELGLIVTCKKLHTMPAVRL